MAVTMAVHHEDYNDGDASKRKSDSCGNCIDTAAITVTVTVTVTLTVTVTPAKVGSWAVAMTVTVVTPARRPLL